MDDIPLPEDIPIPNDAEPGSIDIPTEEICNIKLPDEIVTKTNDHEEELSANSTKEEDIVPENNHDFNERYKMLSTSAHVSIPSKRLTFLMNGNFAK